MEETLVLTQEWDKTFPKSNKVDHSKVTFHNRYGITLAADLYKPKGADGRLAAIAVCGGKDGVITGAFPPCGVCRQVMREFCGDDFLIYMITPEGCEAHTLAEILPFSFSAQKHMHA